MSSRQDLLDQISAKESELSRMRREASDSAAEEIRIRDVRLQELRNDFEHNLSALEERDRVIASLERTVADGNERHTAEMREVKHLAEERVASVEEETRARERKWREEGERNLNAELERRLAERERSLREEISVSASSELADRERKIGAAYERAAAEREATCKRREGVAENRIRDLERSRAEDLRDAEARWRMAEAELRDRATRAEKARTDAEARLRDGLSEADGFCTQRDEQIARMVRELKVHEEEVARLRDDNARLDGLNTEKDGKVSDLLQALIDMEDGFLRQHGELQANRDEVASQLKSTCDEKELLKEDFSRVVAGWEEGLSRMVKDMDEKQLRWSDRKRELIRETELLRTELEELRSDKESNESAARKEIETAKNMIRGLEVRAEQLQIDYNACLEDASTAKKLLESEKATIAHLCQEHGEALNCSRNAREAAERELKTRFQAEIDSLKREKDEALKEQRAALEKVTELEILLSGQESKKTCSMSPLQHLPDLGLSMVSDDSPDGGGFVSPSRQMSRHAETESEIDSIRSENARLKMMVAMMRKEMETLMTSRDFNNTNDGISNEGAARELHKIIDALRDENKRLLKQDHPDAKDRSGPPSDTGANGKEEELKDRIAELNSELEVVLSDRRRLIDLSNKLRVDLQRAQSSDLNKENVDDIKGKGDHVHAVGSDRSHIRRFPNESSLSSHAITVHDGRAETRIASIALGKATSSQTQVLSRLQRNQQKKDLRESNRAERIRVRNWNHQDGT